MTDSNGNSETSISSAFGYFRFENVAAGRSYIVSVVSKRFDFASRIVTVNDSIGDIEIIAEQ